VETTEASKRKKAPPTTSPEKGKGRLKNDEDYDSEHGPSDDEDTTSSEEIEVLKTPSPTKKTKQTSATKTSRRSDKGDEDLLKENEALKSLLKKQSRAEKEKKAMKDEDDLVSMKIGQFVKEVLWKRIKFISGEKDLLRAMNVCAQHFNVPEKERAEWRLRHGRKVQQSINGRRNNCAQDIEKEYKGTYNSVCSVICSSSFDIANHICCLLHFSFIGR
jgi:hypothetical protein